MRRLRVKKRKGLHHVTSEHTERIARWLTCI